MIAKMDDKKIADMISVMGELKEDLSVPRNVKEQLSFCTNALQEDIEMSLRVDKVRHALEQISEDSNLQPYTRTQIWNITSMLEKL